MKSALFAGAALAIAGLGLAACSQESSAPVEASPEAKPGITVEDGRLVLPAVAGNPGAVYFDITYDGDDVAVIRSAEIAGAESASIHDTVEVEGNMEMQESLPVNLQKGVRFSFERGGKHVMAMNLDEGLEPGGTAEVTLTFLGGDKVSFPATILAAGDAR